MVTFNYTHTHNLEAILRPCHLPILKRQVQHLLLNIILLVRLYWAFKKQPLKLTEHLPIFVIWMLVTKTLLIVGQNFTQDCSV